MDIVVVVVVVVVPVVVVSMQESVLVLLLDVEALKNPGPHTSHLGWAVAEPAVFVYLPGGHLVWAVHHSKGQPIANENDIGEM